jgi:hypothetical protein
MTEDDALRTPEHQQWKEAMHQELDKLNAIQTWSYVDTLPPGRKALKHKWVLKNKHDLFGNYIYKARLTVKGCAQREGYDFDETFSPVAKISAVRLLLSLASSYGMILWQFDVQNAFVNAELTDVDIYMEIPDALRDYYKVPHHTRYLRLLRALYGLKQSSREWNQLLVQTLKEIGFTQLVAESCLFYITINGHIMYVVVYVDDMIIACLLMIHIEWLYSELSKRFIVNRVPLSRCLGLDISYDSINRTLSLSKNLYVTELVRTYWSYISDIPYRHTPLDQNLKLTRQQCPTDEQGKQHMTQYPYRKLIGALNYLTCTLRADIAFATNYLARFMDNPGIEHWQQLLQVLAYLRDNPHAYIVYSTPSQRIYEINDIQYYMIPNTLYCFVDADFASSDFDRRRSVTGYVIYFNGGIVSWKSSLQKTTSSSSTEAEYKALHEACKEVLWLCHVLTELGLSMNGPVMVFEDNTSSISASENPINLSQLKHLETKYHQIRDFVEQGQVALMHIKSVNQIADVLTKSLPIIHHQRFVSNILAFLSA